MPRWTTLLTFFCCAACLATTAMQPASAQTQGKVPVTAQRTAQEPEAFRIGVILPLTGPRSQLAYELLIGMEYALHVQTQNTDTFSIPRSTIGGVANSLSDPGVRILYEDDACDPKRAERAYTKLVDEENAGVVVGPVCEESIAAVAKLAQMRRIPILPLLEVEESLYQSEQVYAFAYDFGEEKKIIVREIESRKPTQVVAVGLGEEPEFGVYRGVLRELKQKRVQVKRLTLGQSSPADIHDFITDVRAQSAGATRPSAATSNQPSSARTQILFLSAAVTTRYAGVVRQLERLRIPTISESGVLTGGKVLARSVGWQGVSPKPLVHTEQAVVEKLTQFLHGHYQQPQLSLFLPALGYEVIHLLRQAVAGGTLDVHESLRLYRGKPQVLTVVPLTKKHSYLLRPRLSNK